MASHYYTAVVFVLFVTASVVAQVCRSKRHGKDSESFPGPWGLPYLGHFWGIPRKHAYLRFSSWTKVYGPIYQIEIFGAKHIWLGSERIAKELLEGKRSLYNSDRPAILNVKDSKDSGDYLPLLGHNEKWKRQRKFIHQRMSWSISKGHRDIPLQEAYQMLSDIINEPDKYEECFDGHTARVISRVCYGKVESFEELKNASFALLYAISPSENLTNLIPALRHVPFWLSPWKQTEKRRHDKEREFFFRLRDQVRESDGELEDSFMRQYLRSEKKEISEDEAAYAIGMTALAGMLTTASIKVNYILAICHFPEWQAALQEEIDRVVGDRMVVASDAPNLPILRAVIKELIRWRPVIPASIPHETQKDDWYEGRFIPAGTRIHPNGWALSRDPELYPDPETFNPNRWLKAEYPTYRKPLSQYPTIRNMFIFGYGRRTCMGQDLVENELIVVLGNLAWACNISKKVDEHGNPVHTPMEVEPDGAAYTSQVISRPKAFPFELKPRFEKRAEQIHEKWESYRAARMTRTVRTR